ARTCPTSAACVDSCTGTPCAAGARAGTTGNTYVNVSRMRSIQQGSGISTPEGCPPRPAGPANARPRGWTNLHDAVAERQLGAGQPGLDGSRYAPAVGRVSAARRGPGPGAARRGGGVIGGMRRSATFKEVGSPATPGARAC